MDEKRDNSPVVSYAAFESMMTANEKHIKRLFIALLITIILLFASNVAWIHFFSQFDFAGDSYSDIYSQDGKGLNNINTGQQGDVDYGTDVYTETP